MITDVHGQNTCSALYAVNSRYILPLDERLTESDALRMMCELHFPMEYIFESALVPDGFVLDATVDIFEEHLQEAMFQESSCFATMLTYPYMVHGHLQRTWYSFIPRFHAVMVTGDYSIEVISYDIDRRYCVVELTRTEW